MGSFIDLTNQKYGTLTVIRRGENKYGRTAWICKCDCGNECHVTGNDLRTKKIVSCGCQKIKRITKLGIQNFKNIIGQKYGFLTVIEATEKRANKGEIIWKCKCECGNLIITKSKNLLSGATQSCGCLISKGEQKIMQILQENNIPFEKQKTFNTCLFPDTKVHAKFDFYLPDFNILIEYDGIQHYQENFGWNTQQSFKQLQNRDLFKSEWCKNNNILLIRIPYFDFDKINFNYIKEKIDENISLGHE